MGPVASYAANSHQGSSNSSNLNRITILTNLDKNRKGPKLYFGVFMGKGSN